MSVLGRIVEKVTGRRQLETIGADARRAARVAVDASGKADAMQAQLSELRRGLESVQSELRRSLLQYHLQLGRLARGVEDRGVRLDGHSRLSKRAVPLESSEDAFVPWEGVGGGVTHPDPGGREWMELSACPVCGHGEHTIVSPWNKLLLLEKAPDDTSARYDYAVCHACGVLYARRRPFGGRYRFLLEHFGEVTAKRGGDREIPNPLLNPYPLSEQDRDELRRLVAQGVFVSDHLALSSREYLTGLGIDRFENSGHVDIIGSLVQPRNARVLEVRSRTGSILDGLRRYWNADVYAMPIWESQRFIVQEVYGIPTSDPIDFDRFKVPFEGPFDLIICQHMLTHVLRPAEFFAELRAHLEPGGHLYLHNEPHDREYLHGNQSMIATLNPLHMQAFDQGSLVRALAANGFETVFLKKRDFAHLCLARRADVTMTPMERGKKKRRLRAYQQAYDRAILRLDDRQRSRVAADWNAVVERAVASGIAEFDDTGQLRLVAR
jgi:SAM-dependent methyltransferase